MSHCSLWLTMVKVINFENPLSGTSIHVLMVRTFCLHHNQPWYCNLLFVCPSWKLNLGSVCKHLFTFPGTDINSVTFPMLQNATWLVTVWCKYTIKQKSHTLQSGYLAQSQTLHNSPNWSFLVSKALTLIKGVLHHNLKHVMMTVVMTVVLQWLFVAQFRQKKERGLYIPPFL